MPAERSGPTTVTYKLARRLALVGLAADAQTRLLTQGIRSLLVKGELTASRLYEASEGREYADVDLLVAPGDVDAAVAALTSSGFSEPLAATPAQERARHSRVLRSGEGPELVELDLHFALPGTAPSTGLFEDLWAARRELRTRGRVLTVTDDAGLALTLALHAAHNGRSHLRAVEDLRRACSRMDEAAWREALRLADEHGSRAALSSGLALCLEGREVAERIGARAVADLRTVLAAESSSSQARALLDLAEQRTWRSRADWIRRELFPSEAFMAAHYPGEHRGAARLRRILLLVAALPRALRQVRSARRQAQRSQRPPGAGRAGPQG